MITPGMASTSNGTCETAYLNAPTELEYAAAGGVSTLAETSTGAVNSVELVLNQKPLSESGTTTSIEWTPYGMRSSGAVLSEQERIVARAMALAEPALNRLKKAEIPVERRIVTLKKRVTY